MSFESTHSNGDSVDWTARPLVNGGDVYFPIRRLGDGSFATVWMAYRFNKHDNIRELVALKIFLNVNKTTAQKEYDTCAEFKTMGIRNIINIFSMFDAKHADLLDPCVCLVMELSVGSLYDVMNNGGYENGFPFDFVVNVVGSLLETVSDLHSHGIIHCDIKPENMLLYGTTEFDIILEQLKPCNNRQTIIKTINKLLGTASITSASKSDSRDDQTEGSSTKSQDDYTFIANSMYATDEEMSDDDLCSMSSNKSKTKNFQLGEKTLEQHRIIVADLGSVTKLGSTSHNIDTLVQTRYYKSPEVILGASYDAASDMWSVGCTLYELVTGHLMFDTDHIKHHDKVRGLLQSITDLFGTVPDEIIHDGRYKEIFYTNNNILKQSLGLLTPEILPFCIDFVSQIDGATNKQKYELLDILLCLCTADKKHRICAQDALLHPALTLHNNTHSTPLFK